MSVLELLQGDDRQESGQMEGVAIGLVTNNQDPEGLGRVKVKFPWRENARESAWARVVATGAGKDRGFYWVPEVGDEVLLVCDKKDIQHVFVIGSIWNGKDKAPADNSDNQNNTRLIRSRSGHEIRILDKKGQGKVEIKSEKGHTVTLDDAASTIEIKSSGGSNKITILTDQNSINIESGASLKIKSQTISIEADTVMTLKAGSDLKLDAPFIRLN